MIPSDKDRFECLKLAVGMFVNRQTVGAEKVADHVVQAAEKFYKFVRDDGENGK